MGLFGVKKDPPKESKRVYQVETSVREIPKEKAYEVEQERPQQEEQQDPYAEEEEQKSTSFFEES